MLVDEEERVAAGVQPAVEDELRSAGRLHGA